MKRIVIAQTLGAGTEDDPVRPDVTSSYSVLAFIGSRAVVEIIVSDDAAEAADQLADLDSVTVKSAPLTAAKRTAIKAWLTSQGLASAWVDATITDRQKLVLGALREIGGWTGDDAVLLDRIGKHSAGPG